VRIPLDYYRILGLPIQATAEQLKQSHRDRTLQVPRREYSELAIDARRQLLDKAYDVLGNSARRAEYDQDFLNKTKRASLNEGTEDSENPDANAPTIDIENHLLVGALLILLELGEYELVLRLGRPYIKRDTGTPEGQLLKEQPALPDIILTLAVACLELGREEWQQNHYEHAAESLEIGRELLLKEDLFPVLRAEIQADLYKLRPYRCLELIARPLEQKQSRQEGVNLLRGMLQDRGGIDGADDDLSGLGVDDFLRFVQQLRGYLTAAEQQDVFEAEAQRPSAVGTYLAVYALLARGFAQHQPALIRRAKQMLLRLSGRQDVHLEQAVCAVLLGQTEEASRALELSQELDPLAFIREHSQGSPDLLPGLCLYAENWLQQEVFPFFRDLDEEPATLKDYFADGAVQSYLENLPLENGGRSTALSEQPRARQSEGQTLETVGSSVGSSTGNTIGSNAGMVGAGAGMVTVGAAAGTAGFEPATFGTPSGSFSPPSLGNRIGTAGAAGAIGAAGAAGFAGGASIVDKISKMSPTGQLGGNNPSAAIGDPAGNEGGGVAHGLSALRERRGRRGGTPKWDRVALLILAGLFSLIAGLFLARQVWSVLRGVGNDTQGEVSEGPPLDVAVNEPVIAIEDPSAAAGVATDDARGIAAATINQWLAAKKSAYSSEHDTSDLENVVTGQVLRATQDNVRFSENSGGYIDYTHGDVRILDVSPENAEGADRLTVQAEVVESADVYDRNGRDPGYSYANDTVSATYELVRDGDQWLISDIE